LYDLTSLQREANGRFGFSASRTLQVAQRLYEHHKVITYPRTDARALPEDYLGTVKQTLTVLTNTQYGAFADKILKEDWVKPNKRIFNNAKISDHFAIIPTSLAPKGLHDDEAKLYDMIAKRFLAIFYPAAEFLVTTRITRVEGEPFKSEGKVMVKAGWLEVYGREAQTDDTPSLVPVEANETVKTSRIEVVANQTKPPARFTEATLLSAMEGAGKLVEDEELREAMSEKGLGTPATRAAIIEGLIYEKYLLRLGRELQPTAKAFSLMALLRGLSIPELISPELTGDWEFKLKQMERGRLQRSEFMKEITAMTRDIVKKAKQHEHDTIPGDFGTLKVPCPKCGGEIKETYKKFQCSNEKCDFALWKIAAGRQFEPQEIEELITKRTVGPLQGFRSKKGRPFAAIIKLTDEFKPEFDFGQEEKNAAGEAAEVDFTGQEPLGNCPKCGARVFESGMSYVCEKSTGAAKTCDFRSGKIILQQPVDRAQMTQLLSTGKTDLLPRFISKKGRPFKAFLVLGKERYVGFEFEPRQAKGRTAATKPKEPQLRIDFTGLEPIGKCPRCGGRVFESETDYLCEKSQAERKPCKFKTGKVILQRPIGREQVVKLLATGRTDLLDKFISNKTGRPFSAFLVVGDDGKAAFEFPERESEPSENRVGKASDSRKAPQSK
jgi:DNA topoisomerase-3